MQMIVTAQPDSRRVALRSALPVVGEDAASTWIHVAVEGTWKGHPAGDFTFTREVFASILANFEANPNPIPLTYGHPRGIEGDVTGAAGWITKLEVRDDGLWAFTEFTRKAAAKVREGEHRFCSVVVGFDSVDRESGEDIGPELYEVGLVLTPFLADLNEIRLSRGGGHGSESMTDTPETTEATEVALAMDLEAFQQRFADLVAEMEGDASPDRLRKAFDAALMTQETVEGADEPEAPEPPPEEAEAGMKPEDEDEMAAGDEPAESVEAGDAPEGDVTLEEPMDGAEAAEGDQMMQAAQMIADEISAMGGDADATAVIAFLQSAAPAIAQLYTSESADGEAGEEVATLSAERAAVRIATFTRKLEKRDAEVVELTARVQELEAAETKRDDDAFAAEIEAALEKGHITDAGKRLLVKLGAKDRDAAREELALAAENPAVPQGAAYAPKVKRKRDDKVSLSKEEEEAEVRALSADGQRFYRAARAAGPKVTHQHAMAKAAEKAGA